MVIGCKLYVILVAFSVTCDIESPVDEESRGTFERDSNYCLQISADFVVKTIAYVYQVCLIPSYLRMSSFAQSVHLFICVCVFPR